MANVFALLVGINNYKPGTNVNSLSGCVNDVKSIHDYLKKSQNAEIISLTNSVATRNAVIESFKSHLCFNPKIKEGDTVIFYYSGHGSYAQSNVAFAEFDTELKDETLVLYDSREENNFDLADKEIALLLNAIKPNVNIVVIIDACHSGSITRSVDIVDELTLGKAKHTPRKSNDSGRKLSEYITVGDISYEKMLVDNGKIDIPKTKHIVFSACSRTELAYESDSTPNALFSNAIIQALEKNNTLSYAQLYEHVFTLLKRRAKKQTPQLNVFEGYNANKEFLGDKIINGKCNYTVVFETNWTINCGALYGINNSKNNINKLQVVINTKDGKTINTGITAVGLNHAELKNLNLPNGIYKASITGQQPIIVIALTGNKLLISKCLAKVEKDASEDNILYVESDNSKGFDYCLNFSETKIELTETNETLIHGVKGSNEHCIHYMLHICSQIAQWQQLNSLQNHNINQQQITQKFKLKFGVEIYLNNDWVFFDNEDITIPYNEEEEIPFRFILKAHDESQNNYAAIYYLSRKYSIHKITENVEQCIVNKDGIMSGLEDDYKLYMPLALNEVTDRYKLIISKELFTDYMVPELADIEPELIEYNDERVIAGLNRDVKKASLEDTWFVKNISIKLVRASGVLNKTNDFESGKLKIKKHQSFAATTSVTGITKNTKGSNPNLQLQEILHTNGFELVPLNTGKAADANYTIVLNNLENESDLKNNPLIVEVNHALKDDENVLAFTMVDDIIMPLAIGQPTKNGFEIKLDAIQISNVNEEKKKNILRAAWFCFAKIVLRKNLSMLRRVTFEDNEVQYNKDNLAGKVLNSNRICLYMHGIIGNTKGMATGLQFLHTENKYDLFLAYDYENLNTKIEDIAADIKEKLEEIGISKNKPIDIICHSMGGLVSRYLIEHLEGTTGWVNNLYMFGSPNGGSALGKLPTWRNRIMAMLTIACNFGKTFLGTIGPVLEAINKGLGVTVPVTITLQQMDPESDFYKILNKQASNIVNTNYHIIASSIINYHPTNDNSKFGRLIEKIELQIGKLLYNTEPNDIAVKVESIFDAPAIYVKNKTEISGHHLIYFENQESINYFKTILS